MKRREERAAAQVEQPAPPDRERDQDWLFAQAEKRLAAANEAIRTTRTFFFALLSIAAYIGVVVWGTTDEQLLRVSPVKLPIIGVEVPLTGFYVAVPWLFVILHFNLLIHLGLTSRKLKRFLDELKPLPTDLANRLRNDVANFPLAQWMVGHNDAVFRVVLTVLAWILLVLIPPLLLLWMQLRFLPYQDEFFTRLQMAAVAVDALLIIGFRAWFVRQVQPETRWIAGWRDLKENAEQVLAISFRLTVLQPLTRYLVPLIPLALGWYLAAGLSDLLGAEKPAPCDADDGKGATAGPPWLCRRYRLDLRETVLVQGTLSSASVNALRGVRAPVLNDLSDDLNENREPEVVHQRRGEALAETLGLDLRERHLRGASLINAVLPKADLRLAQLQDADLRLAQLPAADLLAAQLQGADLQWANLQEAILVGAKLRDANLAGAQLQDADLRAAQLSKASLRKAQLQRADLREADLAYADLQWAQLANARLSEARLQRADLRHAGLNGAALWRAQLQGASLKAAQLQDANLLGAKLQGATIHWARLQGANLYNANLEWADLTDADLSFADLTGVKNLETAELAGADYVFADGLEGIILDINQPPPDVLPAPGQYSYLESQCPNAESSCVERVRRILDR